MKMEEMQQGSQRQRDRHQTEQRLLKAASELIARDGFQALGVNALAKEAGVDKVLIYRYFGGLEGLMEQLGNQLELWLGDGHKAEIVEYPSYAHFAEVVLWRYAEALRKSILLQRLLAWELVSQDPLIHRLGIARSRAVSQWFLRLGSKTPPPPAGVDVAVLNALLIGSVHHLVLRATSSGDFAGVDLKPEGIWERIRLELSEVIHARLSPP